MVCASVSLAQPAGQVAPDPKLLSSSSATGGLAGLSNPNLFDGSTTVTVPIYQFEGPGGDYGISFAYNTKGIKVDQVASAIGLGWNLQAGGSIVRMVKDLPDEVNIPVDDTFDFAATEFSTPVAKPSLFTRYKGKYVTYSETSGEAADTMVYRDREADEFTVAAGPLSFTFLLGPNGSFFTIPENRAKIEVLLDGVPVSGIGGSTYVGVNNYSQQLRFRITDVQGNQYLFVRGDYEKRELTDEYRGYSQLGFIHYVTKWDLEQVVLSSGAVIRFTYTNAYIDQVPYYAQSVFKEGTGVYGNAFSVSAFNTKDGNFSKLSSISYPNGTRADFIYDNTNRCDYSTGALREITISGGDNCKRYILEQAYFMASNTGTSTDAERAYGNCYSMGSSFAYELNRRLHRLKLKGVHIESCDRTVSEPYYSFEYDAGRLPMRLDRNQDFFGYANGAPSDVPMFSGVAGYGPMVPTHPEWKNGTTVSGQNKAFSLSHARSSVLTKVRNAYGGEMSFGYGVHVLSNVLTGLPSNNYFLGADANDGLCLYTVTETDKYLPGSGRTTHYSYYEGKRFLTGGYFHYPMLIDEVNNDTVQVVVNGQYVTPHQLINGSNHGYGTVGISMVDGNNHILSSRQITFSNVSAGSYSIPAGGKHFYEFPYSDKTYLESWKIGLPLTVTEFDENDRIVQQTFNTYSYSAAELPADIVNVKTARVERKDRNYAWMPPGVWQKREITDTYRPVRGRAELAMAVTRKYVSDSRYMQDTAQFYYDDRHNLYLTLAKNSRGEDIASRTIYNYNVGNVTGQPATALNNAGLELPLSTERWKMSGSNFDKLLDASISGYSYEAGRLYALNLYKPETGAPTAYSQYEPAPSTPNQKINAALNGDAIAYLRKASEVTERDAKGNPLESRLGDRELYKAMIWDTTFGVKLAEANCRYADIAYTSFEERWPVLLSQVTMGHFTFSPGAVVSSAGLGGSPVTGNKVYRLRSGAGATSLAGHVLGAGKQYLLSFWVYGNTPVLSEGGSTLYLTSANQVAQKGSWTNYQVRFTAGGSMPLNIATAGADIYIDEVRLCPADAQMSSLTHEPLLGAGSTTDARGRISYYEYDKMGRQTLVRDQDGNILRKTEQVVQGQD